MDNWIIQPEFDTAIQGTDHKSQAQTFTIQTSQQEEIAAIKQVAHLSIAEENISLL